MALFHSLFKRQQSAKQTGRRTKEPHKELAAELSMHQAVDHTLKPGSRAGINSSAEPVLTALPAKVVRVDNDRFMVVFSETGRTVCASLLEISLYKELISSGTKNELITRLNQAGWEPETLRCLPDILGPMVNKGLITQLDTWLAAYSDYAPAAPLDISCLAWPTRERPELLDRALGGLDRL